MNKTLALSILLMALLALTGCEAPSTPAPEDDDNAAILTGPNAMPKSLATIWMSPTPDVALASPTPQPVTPTITPTPEPPEPTRTPTAAVGVFVGGESDGTPQISPIPPLSVGSGGGGSGSVSGSIPADGGVPSDCSVQPDGTFQRALRENPSVAAQLGCPRDPGHSLTMVYQVFERGEMYWRDTREIYVLPSTGQYQKFPDEFQDGMPESDPAYDNPPAGLQQPIRGFGLVWRTHESARNALGWALGQEIAYPSYWQGFQNGFMFASSNNNVYALIPTGPDSGQFFGPFPR